MSISRRNFLSGSAACAVTMAIPVPVLPDAGCRFWFDPSAVKWVDALTAYEPRAGVLYPLFVEGDAVYNGVVVRSAVIEAAMDLARTCHPRVTPWGTMSETVLEGIECDGDS